MTQSVTHPLVERHTELLARAVAATSERAYWSPFPESPSPRVYGESAAEDGRRAFEGWLGAEFPIDPRSYADPTYPNWP